MSAPILAPLSDAMHRLAPEWYGGLNSPMYALASTGDLTLNTCTARYYTEGEQLERLSDLWSSLAVECTECAEYAAQRSDRGDARVDDSSDAETLSEAASTAEHNAELLSTAARLEELRSVLRSESISWGELIELQSLAAHIDAGDIELLQAAGVTEGGAA